MRSTLRDKLLSLAVLAALAVHPLAPRGAALAVHAATLTSVVLALFTYRASQAAVAVRSLAAMGACLAVAMELPVLPWQAVMLVALAAFFALGRAFPTLQPSPTWRAKGAAPLGWTALVGGVTPVALFGWVFLFRPDLRDVVQAYIPDLPLPVLVVGAVGFAVINATLEELVWRGVLQDRLEPVFGVAAAVVLQAASFGIQHYKGIPRGAVGVLLAGSWALMLGILRRHTRGMLAPILAHVVADAVIAIIVLTYAR
jgi:membrane protease YdiL (CAAX protease family)